LLSAFAALGRAALGGRALASWWQRRDLADHLVRLVLSRRFFATADVGFFKERAALDGRVRFLLRLGHGMLRWVSAGLILAARRLRWRAIDRRLMLLESHNNCFF
jgi:hypothetical protein